MKLLIAARWSQEQMEEAQKTFPQIQFAAADDHDDILREIVDAEVVFGGINREAFLAAKQLKWIQNPGAGVERLARISEIAESDVTITNTRGAHAATIAEHTFGLLISLTRQLPQLLQAQREHDWVRRIDGPQVGLTGLTLGVVGMGNIGRAIAKRGHAFDMNVIGVDVNEVPKPDFVAELRLLDGLDDLMRRSDVVAVAAPITPETAGMLGPEQLRLMKPTAYLIVVSRGGIIDEDTLMQMLNDGQLAGAGLDVTATEPLPQDSPLWDTPNLLVTPHCSGSSSYTSAAGRAIFYENLRRYLAKEPLTNLVDLKRGF
jgi:phosphoglycerate dehydrogenase-like enzyme